MKMQKPGLDTWLKALSLRGFAFSDAFCNQGCDLAFGVPAPPSRMCRSSRTPQGDAYLSFSSLAVCA